jgi:hypothetical protein
MTICLENTFLLRHGMDWNMLGIRVTGEIFPPRPRTIFMRKYKDFELLIQAYTYPIVASPIKADYCPPDQNIFLLQFIKRLSKSLPCNRPAKT